MTTSMGKPLQSAPSTNLNPISRLGGIAGIVSVSLTLGLVFNILSMNLLLTQTLQLMCNLILVIWGIGAYAYQMPHLGRLGLAGVITASVGIMMISILQFIQSYANANPGNWVNLLLSSKAMLLMYILMSVAFVWGILALGTTSLKAGVFPRGVVVMWMCGFGTTLVTNWLPIQLMPLVGVLWTSILLLRGRRPQTNGTDVYAKQTESPVPFSGTGLGRLVPLDALRGLIMMLMAIDHASLFVRRWHPFEIWNQTLPTYPSLAAMLTRLATHPCAPGFFFLMGAGMLMFAQSRRQQGWSERKIAGHLALRGLLFIALEKLIVDVATSGKPAPLNFSILAGLGAVTLLGILFLRLKAPVQAITGAVIVLAMQIIPAVLNTVALGSFTPIRLLLVPGGVGSAYVLYPPIPWLGLALLGMAFARLLQQDQAKAYKVAGITGVVCLALFPIFRLLGGFGNLRMPAGNSLVDFFNVVKYPPSLSFLFVALGFDMTMLYVFSKIAPVLRAWAHPLVVLGQSALYFFLVHWFIYAAMGIIQGALPQTYVTWAVGLLLLYPICKTYESFKHSQPVASVWRMI